MANSRWRLNQKHQKEKGSMSKEQKSFAVPESGPRESGKDRSATVTRRDSHPAKQKEKSKRVALIADQRVSGFDTGTLGPESFPKKSTANSKKLAARRRKD